MHTAQKRKAFKVRKDKKKLKKKKQRVSFFTFRNIIILLVVAVILLLPFLPAGVSTKTKFIDISKGYGASKISYILKKEGIIRSRLAFRIIFKFRGGHIKAGEYELSSSMTPWRIITMMKAGKVVSHAITIPEGFTVKQIAALFEANGLAVGRKMEELCNDKEFIKKCGVAAPGLEGYLFPSTYFITKDMLIEAKFNREMDEKQKELFKKIKIKKKIIANGVDFFMN